MSVRCRFDVKARVGGVAISVDIGVGISVDVGVDSSVDGGVDISADIGVAIGVGISVDIGVAIGVDTCTSKHIKSFDGALMVGKGSRKRHLMYLMYPDLMYIKPSSITHQTTSNTSNRTSVGSYLMLF